MEFGPTQIQIAVTLALVCSAACVALFVDYLKGNNQQLRELAIELKVRRQEDLRRAQTLIPKPLSAFEPAKKTPAARSVAIREPKRMPSPEALAAMQRGALRATSPAAGPRKDWGAILSRRPQSSAAPQPHTGELPAGFQDGFILSHLVQSRRPVSGLVVSIGVNTPRDANGSMPAPVRELIQSLIGPADFACQSSDEEFLLIYPAERGASAQRKLSQIARQLWDFQLRSLGTFSILFSWGGVEVRSESIEEAISAANDRMQETRRGRNILARQSPLRQAI